MKRGKDDEKNMSPMFPRLHVSDTEKGGPRAPPRNKMALYEQLSIPSQRFNYVPRNNAAPLVPVVTSLSQKESKFVSHVVTQQCICTKSSNMLYIAMTIVPD
ncbi:Protein EARLY FLOWERING [Ranunculus cassubicifolius]